MRASFGKMNWLAIHRIGSRPIRTRYVTGLPPAASTLSISMNGRYPSQLVRARDARSHREFLNGRNSPMNDPFKYDLWTTHPNGEGVVARVDPYASDCVLGL